MRASAALLLLTTAGALGDDAAIAACGLAAYSQAVQSQGQIITKACDAGAACIAALEAAYSTQLDCSGNSGGGGSSGFNAATSFIRQELDQKLNAQFTGRPFAAGGRGHGAAGVALLRELLHD